MTVTVKIITEKKTNTLIIPTSAIQTESGNTVVQIAKPDKTTETRKIVTGITDGTNTEILSGLNLGEKIYLESYTIRNNSSNTAAENNRDQSIKNMRSSTQNLGVGGSNGGGAGGPPM
jgi:hypothetical protein